MELYGYAGNGHKETVNHLCCIRETRSRRWKWAATSSMLAMNVPPRLVTRASRAWRSKFTQIRDPAKGSIGLRQPRYSCRKMFRRELWTRISPLYSMNPNFLKRFMKKLTRERVVPIISANVS
jgi:hypothetical protein